MDDLDRILQLSEARFLTTKVSRLNHAKRMGKEGMQDALRVIDVLLIDLGLENNADVSEMLTKLQTDLREYLKILRNI